MKYIVIFFNPGTEKKELWGEFSSEQEAWASTEAHPELDFWVYQMI